MTRRIRSLTGGMSLLILLAMVVAGCGPAATPEAPTPTPAAATPPPPTPTTPAEPSVFRVAITSDPASLEPGLALELYTSWIAENLHVGLFYYDADSNLVPFVLEGYEISEDGKSYTFHLRDDVYFHNGRKLVADDVKYCWERYLDPDVGSSAGADYLGHIEGAEDVIEGNTEDLVGVEVVDDYTFVVHVTHVDPAFLMRLATTPTWIVPPEAVVHDAPEWVGDPVGAGPFMFVEYQPNTKLVLEANEEFFLGRPTIDRIEYYIVPDAATELAMYEAGEIDRAAVVSTELKRVQEDPTLGQELHFWTRGQPQYFGFNQNTFELFRDVRVRQAFNYALDKDPIIENVLFNALSRAEGLVPPGIPAFDPDLKGYEYNPEKARALMAEAGYPDGVGFPQVNLSAYGRSVTIAEAAVANLNQVLGLNMEVNQLERGDMISGLWSHDKWDFFFFGWTADFLSAEVWLYQMLHCGVESNFSSYCNPEIDALIDEALLTVDDAERIALWREVEQKAVIDDAAMLPLGFSQYIYLVKPYASGFECNLMGPVWFKDVIVSR